MKRIFALISALALLLSGCGANQGDALAERGVSEFAKGNYEDALKYLERAEEQGLNRFDKTTLYFNIGGVKFRLGDYEGSIEAYRSAIALSPDSFDAYVNLGVAYEMVGLRDKAYESYRQALLYDPENYASIMLYMNLGNFYITAYKPFSAIFYLEKARALDEARAADPSNDITGRNPVIFAWLSIAYAMDYQYEKSDQAFDRAVSLGFSKPQEVKERIEQIKGAR
ncbi:MAG: tetratricopeptide repeat protein [Oscillospiraceae bacterium]|nr:tetratricopeptide repeat protein [Oscillospiraceae bacterium]